MIEAEKLVGEQADDRAREVARPRAPLCFGPGVVDAGPDPPGSWASRAADPEPGSSGAAEPRPSSRGAARGRQDRRRTAARTATSRIVAIELPSDRGSHLRCLSRAISKNRRIN